MFPIHEDDDGGGGIGGGVLLQDEDEFGDEEVEFTVTPLSVANDKLC